MGLLTKALAAASVEAGQEADVSLDEMGEALSERIRRLPKKTTTPYTALNLLKAYGSFQSGACLSLNNGIYSSYASVGFGIAKISIPQENIWSKEKTQEKYFKFFTGWEALLKTAEDGFDYWIFPLDGPASHGDPEPWEGVLMLGVLQSSGFNPKSVSAIVSRIADKLYIQGARKEPKKPGIKSAELTAEVIIAQYHKSNSDFGCILFENPEPGGEGGKAGFCQRVTEMISNTGTVVPLPQGRPLILLPKAIDRELIAHLLSKNLKTAPLLSFEANSPENALSRINSLP